jgi:hypothetical protein
LANGTASNLKVSAHQKKQLSKSRYNPWGGRKKSSLAIPQYAKNSKTKLKEVRDKG